jgi:hypothetical protein
MAQGALSERIHAHSYLSTAPQRQAAMSRRLCLVAVRSTPPHHTGRHAVESGSLPSRLRAFLAGRVRVVPHNKGRFAVTGGVIDIVLDDAMHGETHFELDA